MAGWQQKAKEKADAVLALIPQEWRLDRIPSAEEQRDVTGAYIEQYLSAEEIEITNSTAVSIVQKTSTGKWSAVAVAKAFCHRAALAHQLVNCLHEIFFEAALQDAEEADKYFAEHKQPIGPLHGLPVSLKDQFHVKGVDTHMGYVGWIGTFEGKKLEGERVFESEMVKELQSLGTILYCKTSTPQTLMCGETINNIIGYTWNPKNRHLSSGGSSGGEGALISLGGSPLGMGTDIGGSVRIPAAFNGLFGLKPSTGRLPYQGMANSYDGQNSILSAVGPLAKSAADLKLITESILATEPWLHDPLVVNMPWRSEAEAAILNPALRGQKGLAFGVLRNDGTCTPHPPVARAVDIVVKLVSQLGHGIVDWQPTVSHDELFNICASVWDFDGGADARAAFALSGEPSAPQIFSPETEAVTAIEIMKINIKKRELQKAYMEYWNSTSGLSGTGRPVDAIICPLAPFAAARPNKYTYYSYSSAFNMLDYTAVVIPVTTVDTLKDKRDGKFEALSTVDQETYDTYDAELYDGAHVGVQLVGRRHEEEKMIALAKYLSAALQEEVNR